MAYGAWNAGYPVVVFKHENGINITSTAAWGVMTLTSNSGGTIYLKQRALAIFI